MSPRKSSTSSAEPTIRTRYLAIEVAGDQPVPLRLFERELLVRWPGIPGLPGPKVIRFDGRRGLVRLPHRVLAPAREALNAPAMAGGIGLRTVRSYGTLRKGKLWMASRP